MGHFINDGLDDGGGKGADEGASAIQSLGLMATAWSFITSLFTSQYQRGLLLSTVRSEKLPGGKEGLTLRKCC